MTMWFLARAAGFVALLAASVTVALGAAGASARADRRILAHLVHRSAAVIRRDCLLGATYGGRCQRQRYHHAAKPSIHRAEGPIRLTGHEHSSALSCATKSNITASSPLRMAMGAPDLSLKRAQRK